MRIFKSVRTRTLLLLRLDLKPADQGLAEGLLVELDAVGALHLLDPEIDQIFEDRLVVLRAGGLEGSQEG
jgi:hypothetical protein